MSILTTQVQSLDPRTETAASNLRQACCCPPHRDDALSWALCSLEWACCPSPSCPCPMRAVSLSAVEVRPWIMSSSRSLEGPVGVSLSGPRHIAGIRRPLVLSSACTWLDPRNETIMAGCFRCQPWNSSYRSLETSDDALVTRC